jgi:hypothetical protein
MADRIQLDTDNGAVSHLGPRQCTIRMTAVLRARAGGRRNGRDRCRCCPVARRDPPGMSVYAEPDQDICGVDM